MIRQRWAGLGVLVLGVASCGDGAADDAGRSQLGLGAQCVLSDEYRTDFSGFDSDEVVIEMGTGACAVGVCLATGFQGRASCPYGQSAGAGECLTPDGQVVEVAVEPQRVLRPPTHATICSCRCAGPGPGPFCECGQGMECTPLIATTGAHDEDAGSYCIPEGTAYDPASYSRALCSAELGNCEDRAASH